MSGSRPSRCASAAFGLLCASVAQAQLAIDLGLASDNEFRGNSLSRGDPVASFSLDADSRAGWFAGAFVSQAHFSHYSYNRSGPQVVADAGFAHAIQAGWSWEAGVTSSMFPNASGYDYHEFFAGLANIDWSMRLYISPDYYGRGFHSQYVEFDYTHPLGERFRLLTHVGVQHASVPLADASTTTYDARLGVATQWRRLGIQLNWVDTNRVSYAEPVAANRDHRTLIVRLSWPL